MKFGEVKVEEALGAILAHSLDAGGRTFKKGIVLSAAHLDQFRAAGIERITVAMLDPGDVGEDDAAGRVAKALAGNQVRALPAAHGRVDLEAAVPGVLCLDQGAIHNANAIDEAVTVATLPPHAVVKAGQKIATVKIIPYGVAEAAVAAIEALGGGSAVLAVAPFAPKRIGLISTTTPRLKDSLIEKTRAILSARLDRLGNRFVLDEVCPHRPAELAKAIGGAIGEASGHDLDMLLIMGAAATADRRDVIPDALVRAGGRVLRLGMPAEPGNLLMLGELGGRPVIGLPGCVRSPAYNGFDWVLERLVADIPVTADDIQAMGVGGYLKGIDQG